MIHVVAIITAKPGKRAEVLQAFHANVPLVRAEDGCVEYGATIDAEGFGPAQSPVGPDTYICIEKWATPEAMKAHSAAPHMAAYREKTKDLLAGRSVHILTPV